jgi:hypothetical protein
MQLLIPQKRNPCSLMVCADRRPRWPAHPQLNIHNNPALPRTPHDKAPTKAWKILCRVFLSVLKAKVAR